MSRRLLPLLLLAFAALGCGGKPSPETKPEPPPPPAPTTAAQPFDPNAASADRTLEYWQEVGKTQELTARKYAALADPTPDEVKALLADAAIQVDELAAEKVDADAVAAGKGFADELRQRAEAKAVSPDAAGKARSTRATLAARYGRDFPDLTSAAGKEPTFRLARDLTRPTLARELARLKAEAAELDKQIKPASQKWDEQTTARDKLQGEADGLRAILKDQTEDADLKKVREEVLADAVKDLAAKKVEIDAMAKELAALRTKKGDLDRLAAEVSAVLAEGDPAKAEKLSLDKLDRLRVQADRVSDKLAKK